MSLFPPQKVKTGFRRHKQEDIYNVDSSHYSKVVMKCTWKTLYFHGNDKNVVSNSVTTEVNNQI